MPANILPISLHSTFIQKVANFPDNVYNFNEGDNLTTLMKILLGNSGTGQLNNLQLVARLGQQNIEFSNLDNILGIILQVQRQSSEIYSFATNPFIDQLTASQWQEVLSKDASYRERLLSAAEAFQIGATAWGLMTLCEGLTGIKFYVVESWRTPGYGRSGINTSEEIVLIPLIDNAGVFTWNQGKAQAVLSSINKIMPCNFVVSFGNPIVAFNNVPLTNVSTASGYSNYFFLQPTINTTQVTPPTNPTPGSSTRYWVKNNASSVAPYFAHLQTQEISIDLTGSIVSITTSDLSSYASKSVANPSMQVTSTVYGAQ